MTLQIDFWQLVLLLLSFFGACAAGGKLLLDLMQKHLDERFATQESARSANHGQLSSRLDGIESAHRHESVQWFRLERGYASLSERMARVEGLGSAVPGHSDLGDLHERINALSEQVNKMAGEFTGVRSTLAVVHRFLMDKGGTP